MHIRRATLSDIGGIAAAHVAAWRTTYPGIVAQDSIDRRTVEVRIAQWERTLRGERHAPPIVFVAEDAGEIVGFISGGAIREPRQGFDAELNAIYLIESMHGKGVGRQLVQRLAGALVRDGFKSMVVEVLAENPACRFYERMGARLLEENDHAMDDHMYPGRMYGWDDIALLARASDRLNECTWPPLDAPYATALREAVAFIFDFVEPVAVVATGTIVRGIAHATSDLDIYVVHDAPYRRRIQRFFSGVPAEIFINPPHAVRRYFHDEHFDARPITAHMLATGFVLWSTGPTIDELRAEASEWLARLNTPSPEQVVQMRYAAATKFEDALDVAATDPATSSMLMTQAVIAMLELECRTRLGRLPRGKDLLASITESNAELGALAATFFSDAEVRERRQAAESIADLTTGARGLSHIKK
jgi:L-amino acid N-acyltransferase YncA/predicted nucleotidyltransferase